MNDGATVSPDPKVLTLVTALPLRRAIKSYPTGRRSYMCRYGEWIVYVCEKW